MDGQSPRGSGGGSGTPRGVGGLFWAENLRCFGHDLLTILSLLGASLDKCSEFTLSGAQEDECLRLFWVWGIQMLMIWTFKCPEFTWFGPQKDEFLRLFEHVTFKIYNGIRVFRLQLRMA